MCFWCASSWVECVCVYESERVYVGTHTHVCVSVCVCVCVCVHVYSKKNKNTSLKEQRTGFVFKLHGMVPGHGWIMVGFYQTENEKTLPTLQTFAAREKQHYIRTFTIKKAQWLNIWVVSISLLRERWNVVPRPCWMLHKLFVLKMRSDITGHGKSIWKGDDFSFAVAEDEYLKQVYNFHAAFQTMTVTSKLLKYSSVNERACFFNNNMWCVDQYLSIISEHVFMSVCVW